MLLNIFHGIVFNQFILQRIVEQGIQSGMIEQRLTAYFLIFLALASLSRKDTKANSSIKAKDKQVI